MDTHRHDLIEINETDLNLEFHRRPMTPYRQRAAHYHAATVVGSDVVRRDEQHKLRVLDGLLHICVGSTGWWSIHISHKPGWEVAKLENRTPRELVQQWPTFTAYMCIDIESHTDRQ